MNGKKGKKEKSKDQKELYYDLSDQLEDILLG